MSDRIFVFGSNTLGRHGAGAARYAHKHRGAVYGEAIGRQGQSYAIPTKDYRMTPIGLSGIRAHVRDFLRYAEQHPELQFEVTRIGCGLAGYEDADIAPFFEGAPANCDLPPGWRRG